MALTINDVLDQFVEAFELGVKSIQKNLTIDPAVLSAIRNHYKVFVDSIPNLDQAWPHDKWLILGYMEQEGWIAGVHALSQAMTVVVVASFKKARDTVEQYAKDLGLCDMSGWKVEEAIKGRYCSGGD